MLSAKQPKGKRRNIAITPDLPDALTQHVWTAQQGVQNLDFNYQFSPAEPPQDPDALSFSSKYNQVELKGDQ